MKKLLASLHFFFRQRLSVSSDLVYAQIKNFNYPVEVVDVLKYNDAVKNEDQQSSSTNNNEILHPLFYTKISWQIIQNLNKFLENPIDDRILKTIIHQSEYILFHNELELPAALTVVSKIWSVHAHKKGTKILIRFDYYANNKPIATAYSGGLFFGVKCIGEGKHLGEIPKSEKIDEKAIWEEKIIIDKLLPYSYAGKTEIDAPIHTNPKFAKSIGLPNIILQGTCTFAKSVNLILSKENDEKPYKIKSVSAKFTGMVVPPNMITVRLLKKEKNTLSFDVFNNEKKAVIKGGQIILE